MSNFREVVGIQAIFRSSKKIQTLKNMNMSDIVLKRVIWRFQIYNLFREIFKFREDKSNNVFREILKCSRKTAKFKFFAKQIKLLVGGGGGHSAPPNPFILQNCVFKF